MDDLIADFHIHSKYSHDSIMSPESIVKQAKKAGLTCIAITDHGTIRGGLEGKTVARTYGISVIVGTEISTDCGDIIGLNLHEEIGVTRWQDVIKEIRSQGGKVVLPHPYRDHCSIEEIAECVDFIEIWNGRSTLQQNTAAQDLANRFLKPVMYGSDAHVISEIGSVKTRIDPESFQFREIITERFSTASEIYCSQIISLMKQRKWGTLVSQGTRYICRKVWPFP
ncbi:MAG: PHP domain-containing protein [Methanoregula sp.]|nr:PHP domain-containing protein [Methanoregula sp.]